MDTALDDMWWAAVGPPESADDEAEGFVSLGGYSLAAARLVAEINRHAGVELPLTMLLRDNASLAAVREFVASKSTGAAPVAVNVPVNDPVNDAAVDAVVGDGPAARFDLAPSQRRLWLIDRLHPESFAYNVIAALRMRGPLAHDHLRGALGDVVDRHEALRAAVDVDDPLRPVLRYEDSASPQLEVRDAARPLDGAEVRRVIREVGERPVRPDRAPMLLAALVRAGDEDALLVVSLHHMISDQRSVDVLLADLAEAYRARTVGDSPRWATPASYRAYAAAESALVDSPVWRRDLEYWRQLLADPPANRPLPFALPASATPSLRGEAHELSLGAALTGRLDRYARGQGVTPATLFLACLAVVTAGWTGEDRTVVGVPASRRTELHEQDIIGFLVETLPVLLEPGSQPDVRALLGHVRDRYLTAMSHAAPTFDAIVAALDLPPRPFGSPLFQVWFNDLTQGAAPPRFADVETTAVPTSGHAALFEANFYLHRDADGYRLQLVRAVDRVRPEVATELLGQCVVVLRQFLTAADRPPCELSLRTPAATDAWRDTTGSARAEASRAARLSGPAGATLRTPAGDLGPRELERAVAEVAGEIAATGTGAGQLVEIQARRAGGLAVGLLAAWRAGAVAAIVDADAPAAVRDERRALLRPACVLTVAADAVASVAVAPSGEARPRSLPGASHVLFTTGTGGRPAAVVTRHAALRAALDWYSATFAPSAGDRVALLAGLGHDPVLRDLLVPLAWGGSLVIPAEDALGDPRALLELLYTSGVTILHATPSLFQLIVAGYTAAPWLRLDRLRLVLSAGAPLPVDTARDLRRLTTAEIVNGYGTTETPQIAACQRVLGYGEPVDALAGLPGRAVVPLGRGVGGNGLVVLGGDGGPAGIGQPGEILVRGAGLADGYLDGADPSGRFVPDPLDEPGVRAFRTGDLGRLDPDGAVHFAGRLDRQLTVNGFRVEPQDIEAVALRHPAVAQAAAGLVDTPAGATLTLHAVAVAVAIPDPDPDADADGRASLDAETLRRHLRAHLPRHAVPAAVVVVPRLHTNANHKVELRPVAPAREAVAAPAPDAGTPVPATAGAAAGAAAEAELRRWLLGVLRAVVGRDVAPEENFFDAGLTSMSLLRLHAFVVEAMAEPIPATELFAHPTVDAFARFLSGRSAPGSATRRRRGSVDLERVSAEAQQRRDARRQRTAARRPGPARW